MNEGALFPVPVQSDSGVTVPYFAPGTHENLMGTPSGPTAEYRRVVATVLALQAEDVDRLARRWRALTFTDRVEVVTDWQHMFSEENLWHNMYDPILEGLAFEERFRAVETLEAAMARLEAIDIPVPSASARAFAASFGALSASPSWSRERIESFAASMADGADAWLAVLALVTAASMSDTWMSIRHRVFDFGRPSIWPARWERDRGG